MSRLGEVVESSTSGYTAVSTNVFEPPEFGSFVLAGTGVIGLVGDVTHVPADPNRRATPLGMQWEDLVVEHPQIHDLIHTQFRALTVAHIDAAGSPRAGMPPRPPRIHDFVMECPPDVVSALCTDAAFIRMLAATRVNNLAELIAAAVKVAARMADDPGKFVVVAGRRVAEAFRDDYYTASLVIERIAEVAT